MSVNIITLGMFNIKFDGEHGSSIPTTSISVATLGMFSTILIPEDITEIISHLLNYKLETDFYVEMYDVLKVSNSSDNIKLLNTPEKLYSNSKIKLSFELKSKDLKFK